MRNARFLLPAVATTMLMVLSWDEYAAGRGPGWQKSGVETFHCQILKRRAVSEEELETARMFFYDCGLGLHLPASITVLFNLPAVIGGFMLSELLYRAGFANQVAMFYPLILMFSFAQWYGLGMLVEARLGAPSRGSGRA